MDDAKLEVKKKYAHFDPPDLPPILSIEPTSDGWRGLTMDGVVFNVASSSIPYGGRVMVNRNGELAGYRQVPHSPTPGTIDRYLRCLQMARKAMENGHPKNALVANESAMSFAPTLAAHYNRGMILLEMNRWTEGFAEYSNAMNYPGSAFARPEYRRCIEHGLKRWRGEDIAGKTLLLIHDHGFGDSIMMLRYVPMLRRMGARVFLWLPPVLERLASQCAPVVDAPIDADYFCSLIFLLQLLQQRPETIPLEPYLTINPSLLKKWQNLEHATGIAWQAYNTGPGDYPRNIDADRIVAALPGVNLINVQQQYGDRDVPGINRVAFDDFADCAAAMLCCERIISIDTAAVHLAGAIGHPNVHLLLSHWASWRWLSPLYANLHICRQDKPDDWDSALAKLEG